jgi:hypothetical protein
MDTKSDTDIDMDMGIDHAMAMSMPNPCKCPCPWSCLCYVFVSFSRVIFVIHISADNFQDMYIGGSHHLFCSMSHAAFCLVSNFYCFRHFVMVLALRSYHQFMSVLCRNMLHRCMAGARETETGSLASLNVRRFVVATWWSATSCPVLSARCRHSCTRRRPASATFPGRKRISQ